MGDEAEEEPRPGARHTAEGGGGSGSAVSDGGGGGEAREEPNWPWRDPTSEDWFEDGGGTGGSAGGSAGGGAASLHDPGHPEDTEQHGRQKGACFLCSSDGHWSADCRATRVYLHCPYAQKEAAKAQLDARFDRDSKRWYTFRTLDHARRRFPQWRPYLE